jgi:hypothetical protein
MYFTDATKATASLPPSPPPIALMPLNTGAFYRFPIKFAMEMTFAKMKMPSERCKYVQQNMDSLVNYFQ